MNDPVQAKKAGRTGEVRQVGDALERAITGVWQGHQRKVVVDERGPIRPKGAVRFSDVHLTRAEDGSIAARSRWEDCGCLDGFVLEEEDIYDNGILTPVAVPCACRAAQLAAERITAAGVGAKFLPHITVTSGEDWQAPAWRKIGNLLRQPRGDWLTIIGKVGCGKSLLSTITAVRMALRGHSVRWCRVKTLENDLYETFGDRGSQSRAEMARTLGRVDFLILDDLMACKPAFASWLNGVIDDRWSSDRPTMVTTNLRPEEMPDAIGDRAWSRLGGDPSKVFVFEGERDLRKVAR